MEIKNKDDVNQIMIDGEEKEIESVSYKSVMKVASYFLLPILSVFVFLFLLGANENLTFTGEVMISLVVTLLFLAAGYFFISFVMVFFYNKLSKKFGGLIIRIKDKY